MQEYRFSLTRISRIRTESAILSLYGKIRDRENLYSGIFYTLIIFNSDNEILLFYYKWVVTFWRYLYFDLSLNTEIRMTTSPRFIKDHKFRWSHEGLNCKERLESTIQFFEKRLSLNNLLMKKLSILAKKKKSEVLVVYK